MNKRQRDAAYYAANRDRIRARHSAYREANKDKLRAAYSAWLQANYERVRESNREASKKYRALNLEKVRERVRMSTKRWAKQNPAKAKESVRRWQKANPGRLHANNMRRHAGKLQRTPRWLTAEDRELIALLYSEAASLTRATGIRFHVDHILPLRGATVSGLHVPTNLRVVAASVNQRKWAHVEDL